MLICFTLVNLEMMRNKFGFATITSSEYVKETLGLVGNLKKLYPKYPLYICSVDNFSHNYFNVMKNRPYNFIASQVWEKRFWNNMKSRMLKRELAYASKPAFIYFLLKKYLDTVVLLDSDILIKSKIDDLINYSKDFSITLVAARHPLRNWQRTNTTGIFSAGVIGFSKIAICGAEWWKQECFDNTVMNAYEGFYNEQKYLDYLIGHFETKVIRDDGINVSATTINNIKPYFSKKNNCWLTKGGRKIRLFHQSRATNHKIYADKEFYIKFGCDFLGKEFPVYKSPKFLKKEKKLKNKSTYVVNVMYNAIFKIFSNFFIFSMYFKRILFNNELRLFSFIYSIFKKKELKEKLRR